MVPRFPGASNTAVPTGRVKGSNLHPTPAQFGPDPDAWVNVWGNGYDLQWIKDSIDAARSTGVNVFRAIGSTAVVTSGALTRSQYLARQTDVATYCESVGVRYYPTGSSLSQHGTATDAQVIAEVAALYQAMTPFGSAIFGFDMYNEYRDDPAGTVHATQMVADTATAIRNTGNASIPYTASIHVQQFDGTLLRALVPHVTYLDYHTYQTAEFMTANPNFYGPLHQLAPGFKVVVGETGLARTGSTAAQRDQFYRAALAQQNNYTQVLGTCQWAAIDDAFGLFDYTTRTLQTDISGAWAQFPSA